MSAIAFDPLIAEAKRRALRRRMLELAAAGLLAVACLGVALWTAAPSAGGSRFHRYRGPVDSTVSGVVAAAGPHMGISSVGTSGGVTWATPSYYDPHAFWLTSDNGRSWRRLQLPARAYAINPRASFGGIQFVDRRHGWLSFGARIYRTVDGGRTWQRSDSGLRCLVPRCGGIEEMSFSDMQHGSAYMVSLSRRPHMLFRTDDGGTTWRLASRSPFLGDMTPISGGVGFLGVQNAGVIGPYHGPPTADLFRTTDGGKNWSPYFIAGSRSWILLPLGVFGRQLTVVQNAPNPKGAVNLRVGTVWSTTDGGGHWSGAAVPAQVKTPASLSLASPSFWVFAAQTGDDLYVTSNAGHSWQKIHVRGLPAHRYRVISNRFSQLTFSSPQLGWAIVSGRMRGVAGDNTLVRTTDGGRHWVVSGPPPVRHRG